MQQYRTATATIIVLCFAESMIAQPGAFDYSFWTYGGFDARVWSIGQFDDGRVIAGGDFTQFQNETAAHLIRLLPGGGRDTAFNAFAGADTTVRSVACLQDGRVLIGGFFSTIGSDPEPRIACLMDDGSISSDFDVGSGPDSAVLTIVTVNDGRLFVGGRFTTFAGEPHSRLVRLNSDGSTDQTFQQSGMGFNGPVMALLAHDDGSVLVAGAFTFYDTIPCGGLARLLPNGDLDPNLLIGAGANAPIWCVAEQIDSRIILGGEFSAWNGVPSAHLLRLMPDGSLDLDYPVSGAPNAPVLAMAALQSDHLVVGGMFSSIGSFPRNRIVRLLPDGEVDQSFITGSGFSGFGPYTQVCDLLGTEDARVYAAGRFNYYQTVDQQMLCRIDNSIDVSMPVSISCSDLKLITLDPDGLFAIQSDQSIRTSVVDATGRTLQHFQVSNYDQTIDLRQLPPGAYLLSAVHDGRPRIWRIILAR